MKEIDSSALQCKLEALAFKHSGTMI